MWKKISETLKQNLHIPWIIVIILILIIFAFRKIHSNDFWWVLALGRHFWETKEILNTDVFSYTFPNGYFWNHSRLFDIIVYWLYDHGKYISLNTFRFILLGFTYLLFYKTVKLKKHYLIITLLIITLTLIPLSGRLLFRPELITMVLTASYLYFLFKDKYRATRLIWLIPILQIIWANSHAGFVYGLTIIGIFFGGELIRSLVRRRQNILLIYKEKRLIKLLLIFLSSILATFITSYGWKVITLVKRSLIPQEAAFGIAEWHPYSWENLFQLTNPISILFILVIIILIYKNFYSSRVGKKWTKKIEYFSWEEILIFILYLYSVLQHGRFVYIFSLVTALIVAKNIYIILKKRWVINKWWPHLLIIIAFISLIYFNQNRQFGLGPEIDRYPQQAVNFIKNQKIPGQMINKYADGGYLTFNLYPEKQVFIDGRTPNLYTNDFFWRYNQLSNNNIREQIVEQHDINFWLWPRNNGMQKILWNSEDWKLIYFDNISTIYVKNNELNQDLIDKFSYNFFVPTFDVDNLKNNCSEEKLADNPELKNNFIQELEKGLEVNPQSWLHLKNLALVYQLCDFQKTDLPLIEDYLLEALELNPKDDKILYQLGFTYAQMNDHQKAAYYFQKSGKQTPSLIGLGTAQYNLGQYKPALKNLLQARQAGAITDNKYYQTLGRVYYSLDKDEQAIEFYHRYQDITADYSAESYTDLAQASFYAGQLENAQKYLNLALEDDSSYALALELQDLMK